MEEDNPESGDEKVESLIKAVQVVTRIRPLLEWEKAQNQECTKIRWDVDNRSVSVENAGAPEGGRGFSFDSVIPPDASQEEAWALSRVENLIVKVVEGYHATIFAYGQTGSGKTYSMEGFEYVADKGKGLVKANLQTPEEQLGYTPRAVGRLFERIDEARLVSPDSFTVKASFMQIYNEKVYDLLNPVHLAGGKAPAEGLRLRWNEREQFHAENLFVYECKSASEALQHFHSGVRNKTVASHSLNHASSRSHCLFTLTLERNSSTDDLRIARLSLVDLAGSERVSETHSTGNVFREGVNINQSLFVLRKVIMKLASKAADKVLVPYRESKLTALLKHSIGGNSFTLMVACLSPSDKHLEDNVSTLHYATKAANIRNDPVVNLDPKSALIAKLKAELRSLKKQLAMAHDYIVQVTNAPLPSHLLGLDPMPRQAMENRVQGSGYPAEPGLQNGAGDITPPASGADRSNSATSESTPATSNRKISIRKARPSRPPVPPGGSNTPRTSVTEMGEQSSQEHTPRQAASAAQSGPSEGSTGVPASTATASAEEPSGAAVNAAAQYDRFEKQMLGQRVIEAVTALRETASENLELRKRLEQQEGVTDRLSAQNSQLEVENADLRHRVARLEGLLEPGQNLPAPNGASTASIAELSAVHAALLFDILTLRQEREALRNDKMPRC